MPSGPQNAGATWCSGSQIRPSPALVHDSIRSAGWSEPSQGVRTVLLVSSNEALRSQFVRALGDRSVFFASADEEAMKTLRVTRVDAIMKEAVAPLREIPAFIERARHVSPGALVIVVLPPGETSDHGGDAAD